MEAGGSGASGYNIETYWDTEAGDSSNFRDSLVALPENLGANAELLTNPYLDKVAGQSIERASEFTQATAIFSDDKAPVEQVVHGLILSFVLGE